MVEMRIKAAEGRTIDAEVYTRQLPDSNEVQVVFHDLTRVNNLLKEMRHRVKDALNGVKGCLPPRGSLPDPQIESVVRSVELRIQAMAKLHEILLPQRNRKDDPMRRYLNDLTELACQAHGDGRVIRHEVEVGADLRFEEKSRPCGRPDRQ